MPSSALKKKKNDQANRPVSNMESRYAVFCVCSRGAAMRNDALFRTGTGFKGMFVFFHEAATTEIYTLSLHDALPISPPEDRPARRLADIACPPDQVPVARPEEPLVELLSRLGGCADGRAVVVDESGRVIGLVSPRDISNVMAVADLRGTQPYPLLGADLNTGRPKLTKSRW